MNDDPILAEKAWLAITINSQLAHIYGGEQQFVAQGESLLMKNGDPIPAVIRHPGFAQVWDVNSSKKPKEWLRTILYELLPVHFKCIVEGFNVYVSKEVYEKFNFPAKITQLVEEAWLDGTARWSSMVINKYQMARFKETTLYKPKFRASVEEIELKVDMSTIVDREREREVLLKTGNTFTSDLRAFFADGQNRLTKHFVITSSAYTFFPVNKVVVPFELEGWSLEKLDESLGLILYKGKMTQSLAIAASVWKKAYVETSTIAICRALFNEFISAMTDAYIGEVTSRLYFVADPILYREISLRVSELENRGKN